MRTLQCANCGTNQQIQELYPENFSSSQLNKDTFSARRTPDRIHYRFVRCVRCELIFSTPILSANKIEKFYAQSGFEYNLEASYLKKTYGAYLKESLKGLTTKKKKLLDIGCGNGFFLMEAKDMGLDVFGIEPGKSSILKAPVWLQKKITLGFFTDKSFKKNTFDIVTCFHTLDHIIDPNTFLTDLNSVLTKNGRAIIIVHNTDGLSVKLFGEKSPIFDIEHIYLFNKKSLVSLFEKNNFRVIRVFDVTNTYPLIYWVRMTPFPALLKKVLMKIVQLINIENIPLTLKAGNIGIIVEK